MGIIDVAEGIYAVGGPDITSPEDAYAYLVIFGNEAALIDAGCDDPPIDLISNIEKMLSPSGARLSLLVLTHNHIDHVGGAAGVKEHFKLKIAMHELDAPAMETGDTYASAADWYDTTLASAGVDIKINEDRRKLSLGDGFLECIHTPGHTPGSISVIVERGSQKILFGQDIHGPFSPQFRSDKIKWRESMSRLIALGCDVLCEGHFGIIQPAASVEAFIRRHLKIQS